MAFDPSARVVARALRVLLSVVPSLLRSCSEVIGKFLAVMEQEGNSFLKSLITALLKGRTPVIFRIFPGNEPITDLQV